MNNQRKKRRRMLAVWMRILFWVVLGLIAGMLITSSLSKEKPEEEKEIDPTPQFVKVDEELIRANERIQELEKSVTFYRDGTPDFSEDYGEISVYDSLPLPSDLQEYTFLKCVDYDIPQHYELILAMMWQECHFDTEAVSSTNDYGLMQINKVNHEWLRKDLGITDFLDPRQSIDCGVHIVASLLHDYKGDVNKALMAYNMGKGGAAKAWKQGLTKSKYSSGITTKQELVKQNSYAD